MENFNPQSNLNPKILATDLDGTLIPLPNSKTNRNDLVCIKSALNKHNFQIIFATGRQFSSVIRAIEEHDLPIPEYLICDVGTSLYKREMGSFSLIDPYHKHLKTITKNQSREVIFDTVIKIKGIEPQSQEHQQRFKISFICESSQTENFVRQINQLLLENNFAYQCMGSIDPFQNRGMLDLLPTGTSKAYALVWLSTFLKRNTDEIVYAGDSGNDLAALTFGFKSILVANASDGLAKLVREQLKAKSLEANFFHASKDATSGVLEGCRFYGLI